MNQNIIEIDNNCYLLVDTCVINFLVEAYENPKNAKPWADDFYKSIEEKGIQLLISDLVIFEFLRGSRSQAEYDIKMQLLEEIFEYYMEIKDADISGITKIANIHNMMDQNDQRKVPSFTDVALIHILKNFTENDVKIILVTTNYHDFSTQFLERQLYAVDCGDHDLRILTFHKYNSKKFSILSSLFDKASYRKPTKKKKK